LRCTTVIAALCLLSLALCFAGCQPQPPPSPVLPPSPVPPPSVVLEIKTADVQPKVVQPGKPVTFRVQHHVVAPPGKAALRATVSGQLFFNQQPFVPMPRFTIVLRTDNPIQSFPYPIPEDAAEGTYAVEMLTTLAEPGLRRVTARTKRIFFDVRRSSP
jgi:hypothetical protein